MHDCPFTRGVKRHTSHVTHQTLHVTHDYRLLFKNFFFANGIHLHIGGEGGESVGWLQCNANPKQKDKNTKHPICLEASHTSRVTHHTTYVTCHVGWVTSCWVTHPHLGVYTFFTDWFHRYFHRPLHCSRDYFVTSPPCITVGTLT